MFEWLKKLFSGRSEAAAERVDLAMERIADRLEELADALDARLGHASVVVKALPAPAPASNGRTRKVAAK